MKEEFSFFPLLVITVSLFSILNDRRYDIVVDATNSLASRYMLSDCCVLLNKVTNSILYFCWQQYIYYLPTKQTCDSLKFGEVHTSRLIC